MSKLDESIFARTAAPAFRRHGLADHRRQTAKYAPHPIGSNPRKRQFTRTSLARPIRHTQENPWKTSPTILA